MSRNKSFDVRARFGAIYSASKTKKYLLKNTTIGNQLLFSFLANTEFTRPENSNWWLLLPDSNYFWSSKTISKLNFERLLLQRFFWNFSLVRISKRIPWEDSTSAFSTSDRFHFQYLFARTLLVECSLYFALLILPLLVCCRLKAILVPQTLNGLFGWKLS